MLLVCGAGLRPPKREKKPQRRLMEVSVCLEELMDTPTFKRFNTALDGVLEAAEDMDLASIRGICSTVLSRCYHAGCLTLLEILEISKVS